MAKTIVTTDDIDGSADARTVHFSVDGQGYEIDLSDGNIAKLKDVLAPFISNGRKTSSASKPVGRKSRSNELQEIRKWAAENGFTVSPRGRVPQEVVDAFNAR